MSWWKQPTSVGSMVEESIDNGVNKSTGWLVQPQKKKVSWDHPPR